MNEGFEYPPEKRYKKFSEVLRIWEQEMANEPSFPKWLEKEEAKEDCRLYHVGD